MGIFYGTDKQQQYYVCFVRKWEYILKWHIIMGFEHSKKLDSTLNSWWQQCWREIQPTSTKHKNTWILYWDVHVSNGTSVYNQLDSSRDLKGCRACRALRWVLWLAWQWQILWAPSWSFCLWGRRHRTDLGNFQIPDGRGTIGTSGTRICWKHIQGVHS